MSYPLHERSHTSATGPTSSIVGGGLVGTSTASQFMPHWSSNGSVESNSNNSNNSNNSIQQQQYNNNVNRNNNNTNTFIIDNNNNDYRNKLLQQQQQIRQPSFGNGVGGYNNTNTNPQYLAYQKQQLSSGASVNLNGRGMYSLTDLNEGSDRLNLNGSSNGHVVNGELVVDRLSTLLKDDINIYQQKQSSSSSSSASSSPFLGGGSSASGINININMNGGDLSTYSLNKSNKSIPTSSQQTSSSVNLPQQQSSPSLHQHSSPSLSMRPLSPSTSGFSQLFSIPQITPLSGSHDFMDKFSSSFDQFSIQQQHPQQQSFQFFNQQQQQQQQIQQNPLSLSQTKINTNNQPPSSSSSSNISSTSLRQSTPGLIGLSSSASNIEQQSLNNSNNHVNTAIPISPQLLQQQQQQQQQQVQQQQLRFSQNNMLINNGNQNPLIPQPGQQHLQQLQHLQQQQQQQQLLQQKFQQQLIHQQQQQQLHHQQIQQQQQVQLHLQSPPIHPINIRGSDGNININIQQQAQQLHQQQLQQQQQLHLQQQQAQLHQQQLQQQHQAQLQQQQQQQIQQQQVQQQQIQPIQQQIHHIQPQIITIAASEVVIDEENFPTLNSSTKNTKSQPLNNNSTSTMANTLANSNDKLAAQLIKDKEAKKKKEVVVSTSVKSEAVPQEKVKLSWHEFQTLSSTGSPTHGGAEGDADDQASRILWVGNIGLDVSEEELKTEFGVYGELESVRILHDRFCAFVNFKDAFHAAIAKKNMHNQVIGSQFIVVNFRHASKDSDSANSNSITGNQSSSSSSLGSPSLFSNGGGNKSSSNLENGANGSDNNGSTLSSTTLNTLSRAIYIGNVSDNLGEKDIRKECEKYGDIESVRVLRKKACAFVNFMSVVNATQALQALNGKRLGDTVVRVNYGKPQPHPDNNSSNNQINHMSNNKNWNKDI